MTDAVTLFQVAGIPVRVHASWLVIVGLLTWSLSVGYFPQVLPDLPAVAYWTKGLLATLLLFASVFLHELSHALVARHPLSDALTTMPDTPLWEAFEKLTRNGVGRLAVLDRDRLVGYLSIRDVVHILAVTGTRGEPTSGPRGAAAQSPGRRETQRAG